MRSHLGKAVAALASVAIVAGCSASGGGSDGSAFIYGSSTDPSVLDGSYVYDNESQRVIYQIYEGLTTVKPGTSEVAPGLAKEWKVSDNGLDWTFNLRDGVTFHDGSDFDAAAVCFNFDRWYNYKGPQQSLATYWQITFGGFATDDKGKPAESKFKSCEVKDDATAVIHLNTPYSPLAASLATVGFGMASPTALKKYGDEVEVSGSSFEFKGTFGSKHPTGTGPFAFKSWKRGDKLTLERNDDYWGDKAKLASLIYKPIPDGQARRQALENGEIDGYDNVAPQDVDALESSDYVLEERPPSNVGYLGFNRAFKPFDNAKVRQSIAHAVNREALLEAMYPPGSILAEQWVPPSMSLEGTTSNAASYDYDPAKAKQLLDASGVSKPTLELWYATGVTRPYMPDPKAIASTFKADLEKVGFTVNVKGVPWTPDFLGALRSGKAPMYIVGLLPDLADPSQYFATFDDPGRWGKLPKDLLADIEAAEAETDPAKRVTMYQDINAKSLEDLPGLPFVHGVTHLAFAQGVTGFKASPVFAESMANVEMNK